MPDLWLLVREGPGAGREHPVGGELVIGRGPAADLALDDPAVSRRHASLKAEGNTAVIEDLGSRNGTLVNGNPVEQRSRVSDGDVIQLGDRCVLEVRLGPTDAQPLTPPGEPTVEQSPDPRPG